MVYYLLNPPMSEKRHKIGIAEPMTRKSKKVILISSQTGSGQQSAVSGAEMLSEAAFLLPKF